MLTEPSGPAGGFASYKAFASSIERNELSSNKEGCVIRTAAATQNGNVFSAELPLIEEPTEGDEVMSSQYAVYPGCGIFAQIETDCVPYPKQQKTICRDLYTGYEFEANNEITILPQ